MPRSLSLLPLLFVAGSLAACSATTEDSASAEANATDAWAPYAADVRPGLHRLEPFEPAGASIIDFGSEIRNQGHIASCASFSFLGLIENQMFNQRGITPDLSERYMLYSNFLQTGTLGGDPTVIARFPELTANIGLMSEDLYPYAGIDANASRFEADAAQGLATGAAEVLLSDAIKDTAPMSKERSAIIERADYAGALPAGPYPVLLPLTAKLAPDAKIPEVEIDGKIYSCFATDPSTKPRLAVTPKEALKMCFDFQPTGYFTCSYDEAAAIEKVDAMPPTGDECLDQKRGAALIASKRYEANVQSLRLAIALLESGDAAMLGVQAPAFPRNAYPIWSSKDIELGGGHAVLAVGYASYEDLGKTSEQTRGILGNGLFDQLDAKVEAGHMEKIAAAADDAAKAKIRLESALGQRMKSEGGLIVFRNSWGKSFQGQPIGIDGNQAMTFDFFMKSGMLAQGVKEKALGSVVEWASDSSCPAKTSFNLAGAWSNDPAYDSLKAWYESRIVQPNCR